MTGPVWGFKGRNSLGGTTVLADLDAVPWDDRRVNVVFDSDAGTSPLVSP